MANQSFRQATPVNKLRVDTVFGVTQDESVNHDGSDWNDRSCDIGDLSNSLSSDWDGASPISTGSSDIRAAGQLELSETENTPLQAFGWFGVYLKFPIDAVSLDTITFSLRGNGGSVATRALFAFYNSNTHLIMNLAGQTLFQSAVFNAGSDSSVLSAAMSGLIVPENREMYMLMKGSSEDLNTAQDITVAAANSFDYPGMRSKNVVGTHGHVFAIPDGSTTPPPDLSNSTDGSGASYNREAAILFTYK